MDLDLLVPLYLLIGILILVVIACINAIITDIFKYIKNINDLNNLSENLLNKDDYNSEVYKLRKSTLNSISQWIFLIFVLIFMLFKFCIIGN